MIKSWGHRGLKELFETGKTTKVDHKLHARIIRRLDALNVAHKLEDLRLPGFDLHMLSGHKPKRYTIHVNGPWCISFEFVNGNAEHVHFENYH